LLGAFAIQIGTNFANDVFDFERGADTEERLGPTRAVQAGWIRPRSMLRGMWVAFGVALLAGAYLISVAGWPIAVVGLASILSGIAYTGGPYPLGYHGLGDLFVILFFGFVAVLGTSYVQVLVLPTLAWAAAVPIGALAAAILVVNNVRDEETDRRAGKGTLVARLGRSFGLGEYWALLLLSYATPPALWVAGLAGPWVLLPLLTLPMAWGLGRRLHRERGRALNPVLVGTAKLVLLYGALFTVGIGLHP
jgi:1,4-dihydroxy-2-naphthoate octaprenyltransferase